ncbi:hypothetical protein [Acidithiobacillus ferridurans]|jgi:hypothetical protein|uniref:hypothetical protein n=1 Tax=Acidithiobacillus ferridurans TaxID=1232575 RepID=UPI001C07C5A7|nr:hypothetical protein [Acidithiobacillus ferridurans]MBU2731697.1 hypothetical protein [Acidithiobacillus ferridurans]
MSHKLQFAAIVVILAVAPAAMAQRMTELNPILSANNEIGLAATGTLMNYQERLPSPSDIESGWMPGFAAKYTLMGDYFSSLPNLYFAVNYQFNSGDIAYHGALQNTTPLEGTDSATTNWVLARLGMGLPLAQSWMFTPYMAGGYQNWNRNLQGPYGYTEKYSAGLVGVGLMLQYAPTAQLVLSANAQGLAVIGGGMTPSGTPLQDRLGTASFGSSGQERISLDADYRLNSRWHVYGGLNFTHFNYTGGALNSPLAQFLDYTEPPSSTNLFGMQLGVAYGF